MTLNNQVKNEGETAPDSIISTPVIPAGQGHPKTILITLVFVIFAVMGAYYYLVKDVNKVVTENELTAPAAMPKPTVTDAITPGLKTSDSRANEFPLTVSNPAGDVTVQTGTIIVAGVTKPNSEVFVNQTEAFADAAGKFSVRITLEEGDNYVTVVVTDQDGKVSEIERIVTYEQDIDQQ